MSEKSQTTTADSLELDKQQQQDIDNNMPPPASPSKSNNGQVSFKLILLILMVLQNSSTVLVGRHSRSSVPKEELYVVNHLILITEAAKFLLSGVLEHVHSGNLVKSLQQHVVQNPLDALKMMVPSLLYLVQNSLLYIALGNLSAPLFQVTYQAKLVTTAIVSVVMLQRRYSTQQWICLVVLSVGVAIVVMEKQEPKPTTDENTPTQSLTLGLASVTIACLSSALAGVYFEKVLKRQDAQPVSLWMRNIQLAFFSVVISFLKTVSESTSNEESMPFWHGFTGWVWILVGLQAGGGLLVAAVIKYADNVLKGLATGVSVVVATVCSMLLFGTPLSMQFTFGAILILGAVYLFSNNVPGSSKSTITKSGSVELKPMLPK